MLDIARRRFASNRRHLAAQLLLAHTQCRGYALYVDVALLHFFTNDGIEFFKEMAIGVGNIHLLLLALSQSLTEFLAQCLVLGDEVLHTKFKFLAVERLTHKVVNAHLQCLDAVGIV